MADHEMTWETVGIPLVNGIDVNTRARLVEQGTLAVAENVHYPGAGGPERRRGHVARRVRGSAPLPATGTYIPATSDLGPPTPYTPGRTAPAEWLFGYGLFDTSTGRFASTPARGTISPHPDAGVLAGIATRDAETLLWDGFRLFSHAPSSATGRPMGTVAGAAVLPAIRTSQVAKTLTSQRSPDLGDNGSIRVVAWQDVTAGARRVRVTILDSVSGAPLAVAVDLATAVPAMAAIVPVLVRVVPVGSYVHVLVSDSSAALLHLVSIDQDTRSLTYSSLGDCPGQFATWKSSEAEWLVAMVDSAGAVACTYLASNGSPSLVRAPARTAPALGGGTAAVVAVAVAPQDGSVCLAWWTGATQFARIYDSTLVATYARVAIGADAAPERIAVAPLWLAGVAGEPVFDTYWDFVTAARPITRSRRIYGATADAAATRYNVRLASAAARVGNISVVALARSSTLQSTFYLADSGLLPVGAWEYGTAQIETDRWGFSLNWRAPAGGPGLQGGGKDNFVFHGAFGYRVRVAATEPAALFAEASIKFLEIDFLPPLRAAQAGGATYLAGAQLWQYDGVNLAEAGALASPEEVAGAATNGAGALTSLGSYRYRVYLCIKNARGEEVRSLAFTTVAVPTGAADNTVTLTIPTLPMTRWEGSYFLVYRNENNGVLWYLVSSRDPASTLCPKNVASAATVSFEDRLADSAILSLELDPANQGDTLVSWPAPACDLVTAGHGRLWTSGGENPPGTLNPSRLYLPGECPGWNPALAIAVDTGTAPITAVRAVGESVLVFRRDRTYLVDGDGPDNNLAGSWGPVRLALADVGAVAQEGTVLMYAGIVFQSPGGFRLVGPGGSLTDIGKDVLPLSQFPTAGAVLVQRDQEVRFYPARAADPVLTWNYGNQAWTTATGLAAAGAVVPAGADAVSLARPRGDLWGEADGVSFDDGAPFRSTVRSAWIRAGALGDFQRVRRVGAVGEMVTASPLRVRIFYDEREFHEEEFTWDPALDLNTSTWGDGLWGQGSWGDVLSGAEAAGTATAVLPVFHDRVWRWRFRVARQKCSVISIELSDDGGSGGGGWIPTALLLEIGRRGGLDRIPWRSATSSRQGGGAHE